jgi:hypothetical protein
VSGGEGGAASVSGGEGGVARGASGSGKEEKGSKRLQSAAWRVWIGSVTVVYCCFFGRRGEVRGVRLTRIGWLGSCFAGALRETAFPDLIGPKLLKFQWRPNNWGESHLM